MGKCILCEEFMHPDYMIEVDEGVQKCVFCQLDKKYITITNDKDNTERVVYKADAIKDYKTYINKLYNDTNIKHIIKGDVSEIKK